jgi:hypothetical protein
MLATSRWSSITVSVYPPAQPTINAAFTDNLRPEVGVKQRKESPIIGLKNFNNWVKSVLITQFGHPALAAAGPATGPAKKHGKVLDMGCGKGGDLIKWGKARIREMLAVGKILCINPRSPI